MSTSELLNISPVRRPSSWPVLANSLFWTAGNSLTSGGFLAYFAVELGAKGTALAVLLTLPELLGVCGLLSRRWIAAWGPRRVFVISSLTALVPLALIPLLAFPATRPGHGSALAWLIGLLAVNSLLRGVTFVALLCWLTRVVPPTHWGRFLAWRQMVQLGVLLVVPVSAGFARDWWKQHLPGDRILWAYAACFVAGVLLLALSVAVVSRVPEVGEQADAKTLSLADRDDVRRAVFGGWAEVWGDLACRRLILFSWTHAFASGLTQAAFFQYRVGPLGIGLGTFYLLEAGMRLAQVPVSWWSGRGGDVRGPRKYLAAGVITAALSLVFWLLATREQWWWLWGAYLLWGGWGAINVAGPGLLLRVAPPKEHAVALAMFQNVAGLLAGVAGLVGGVCLDRLLDWQRLHPPTFWNAWRILFAVSLCGRLAAGLWLLEARGRRAPELRG